MTDRAVIDTHTGWTCDRGASLIANADSPGKGHLPDLNAVIYVCPDHQADGEARITAAGYDADTQPAPPGHRWDPWPCGRITAFRTKAAAALTRENPMTAEQTPAPTPETTPTEGWTAPTLDRARRYLVPVARLDLPGEPDEVHLALYEWLPRVGEWVTGPALCGVSTEQGALPEGTGVTCASCLERRPGYERALGADAHTADPASDASDVHVTSRPGHDQALITLPFEYLDTQAWTVELGVDPGTLRLLRAAIDAYAPADRPTPEATQTAEEYSQLLARIHALHGRHHRALSDALDAAPGTDWAGLAALARGQRERADAAEAALGRVRGECAAIVAERHGQHDEDDDGMREAVRRVLAALDDQPTTEGTPGAGPLA